MLDSFRTTVGPPNIDADAEHAAWLTFNLEIKHSAYAKRAA